MDSRFDKESLTFYLMGACAALAAVATMCMYAVYAVTQSVGFVFGVTLLAFVAACCVYAQPSPLNKLRSRGMFVATAALCVLSLAMFVVCDMVRLGVELQRTSDGFVLNSMGIVMLVVMGCGIVVALLVGLRMTLGALGKSLTDAERKLRLQDQQPEAAGAPRRMDERQMVAKAEQQVRRTRMSIVAPAAAPVPEDEPAPVPTRSRDVSPVRAPRAPEPIVPESPAVVMGPEEEPVPMVSEEEVAAILAEEAPVEPEAPQESTWEEDPVVASDLSEASENSLPIGHVAMARGIDLRDNDIRTEMAQHRPRQRENADANDDLYTDFAYEGNDFSYPQTEDEDDV